MKVEPYYQDEWVTIYHGDCREILPEMPMVDLVLTDPPFFMPATHYQSRINWQRTWGDTSVLRIFWEVVADLIVPKLKRSGHFMVFCNHDSYAVFYPVMYARFDYLKAIVWDKEIIGLGRVWRNQHELIIASRWDEAIFYEESMTGRSDVLRRKATPSHNREHPVEKPVALLGDLMIPTTQIDDVILDSFAGSGTTLLAAKKLNRKSIGIEIEEKYCEIAANRCRQMVMELS